MISDHVTLKTGVMAVGNSDHRSKLHFKIFKKVLINAALVKNNKLKVLAN